MRHLLALLLLAAAASGGCAQVLPLPVRAGGALSGSQIASAISALSVADRETFLLTEIAAGNVPAFLRRLVPCSTTAVIGGRMRTARFWVTPDYLALGSNADSFRMPMTPILAQQVADRTECSLPTRKMVDAIWARAAVKLTPLFFNPTVYNILSPAIFYRHHQRIQAQLGAAPPGPLVAGIKKDVVVSPLIASHPTRVVIYGWHQLTGVPIQPLTKVHVNTYADYSHGIRLVRSAMTVDGQPTTVRAVLADPVLHVLLSDEGAFTSSSYPVPAPYPTFPLRDSFPLAGPLLPWTPKFTPPQTIAFAASPPDSDGTVVVVHDPAGGTDTIRLGSRPGRDAVVQADIYCEYRPQLAADGFERVGIFARDNAAGAFEGTLSQNGASYALTWDSDTGRLRCLRAAAGAVVDLNPAPVLLPSTAWRRLRIEAVGSQLTFVVDDTVVLRTNDATFPSGEFGIGYHEYFATNRLMKGTRADNFYADLPPRRGDR